MGHSPSRSNGAGDPLPSRFARFRRRLRLHRRRRSGDDSASAKAIAADEFAGIARIRILKVCCCFVGSLLFFFLNIWLVALLPRFRSSGRNPYVDFIRISV